MFIGPVFHRELVTAPRRPRLYLLRTAYVGGLLVLMFTAWLVLTGTHEVRNVSDFARFGSTVFQLLTVVQLALAVFFSALFTAAAVSQEKDRKTLILLLLTQLNNSELVLGKLLSALLNLLSLLAAAVPVFMFAALFGGFAAPQIIRVFAVTLLTVLVCGSLGSTIALWREKTFQALALTAMMLIAWFVTSEIVALLGQRTWLGLAAVDWASAMSPLRAAIAATHPSPDSVTVASVTTTTVHLYLMIAALLTIALNGLAIARIRVWNPSREIRRGDLITEQQDDSPAPGTVTGDAAIAMHAAPGKVRDVWDQPIIWREIRTWAYGRKVIAIRLAYVLMFTLAALSIHWTLAAAQAATHTSGTLTAISATLAVLFFLSLVLTNALAVTAITNERDGKALDLLLVTDIKPAEFILGKLGGVFYNSKEMVVLPLVLCGYLWAVGVLATEATLFVAIGLVVLDLFVAMLGIHVGLAYDNSRTAVTTSLGTVFFLFLGSAVCIWIMVAFGGSFSAQFVPFFCFLVLGGIGLFLILGIRNPSKAIGLAATVCPFATFYAITTFLLNKPAGTFIATVAAYGFATAAMLIPAISEFDVATGRTTAGE